MSIPSVCDVCDGEFRPGFLPPSSGVCTECRAKIERGLADVEAGRLRSYEDVFGTPDTKEDEL